MDEFLRFAYFQSMLVIRIRSARTASALTGTVAAALQVATGCDYGLTGLRLAASRPAGHLKAYAACRGIAHRHLKEVVSAKLTDALVRLEDDEGCIAKVIKNQ